MTKLFIYTILSFYIFSCGSGDKQAYLRELEEKRDALTKEIEKLKLEIAQDNGELIDDKITYVEIKEIIPVTFKHFIKVQGTIKSDNNIFIPSQSSGIVKKIYVREGDKVSKGKLLAKLDGAIYESTINELETNFQLAKTIFERQERLWKKKIGSEIQYLQAKNNKEALEKKLATVTEQYKLTKIIAPISGTVDEIHIKEGEAAAAGFGAIRIVQLSELKIEAAVSENYISKVSKGDTVEVFLPVLEKSFMQKVNAVSQVIDPKNRTFNIEIKISQNELSVKPNMLVILSINDYYNPFALTVPINIIQRTGSEEFLFVVNERPESEGKRMIVEKRFIKTGEYYDDQIEIIRGINENEKVVVIGFQDLADQQIVIVSKDHTVGKYNE